MDVVDILDKLIYTRAGDRRMALCYPVCVFFET